MTLRRLDGHHQFILQSRAQRHGTIARVSGVNLRPRGVVRGPGPLSWGTMGLLVWTVADDHRQGRFQWARQTKTDLLHLKLNSLVTWIDASLSGIWVAWFIGYRLQPLLSGRHDGLQNVQYASKTTVKRHAFPSRCIPLGEVDPVCQHCQ